MDVTVEIAPTPGRSAAEDGLRSRAPSESRGRPQGQGRVQSQGRVQGQPKSRAGRNREPAEIESRLEGDESGPQARGSNSRDNEFMQYR